MNGIEEIIEAIDGGDKNSYGIVIEQYQQSIFKYCYHMLGSVQESEDTVQDVFIKGLQNLSQFRQGTSFSAWLYKIAYHQCLNKLKRRKKHSQLMRLLFQPDYTNPVEEKVSYDPLLQAGLDRLRPKARTILLLRTLEDKSFCEIADTLQMTEAAVRKSYERSIKTLRTYLNSKQGGASHEKFLSTR